METRRGFTLLELLMVVIIVGILAAIALPRYFKTAEKSRSAEAIAILGQIRTSEVRYLAENPASYGTLTQIDFDPSTSTGTPRFIYTVTPTGATDFVAVATRNGLDFTAGGGCTGGYTVRINAAGIFGGRDCQSTGSAIP